VILYNPSALNLRIERQAPANAIAEQEPSHIVDVCYWPVVTIAGGLAEVCCRRQSRLDLLTAGIAARDPKLTSSPATSRSRQNMMSQNKWFYFVRHVRNGFVEPFLTPAAKDE